MSASVLVVEDEPEFMRRFAEAVLADPTLQLTAVVPTGGAAIALLDAQAPDAMLVDLGLPDISGVDVIRHAALKHPTCDILVVTMFGDDEHVMASIEAGATGYLLKDASPERIAAAIHELRDGGSPISPSIARRVLSRFRVAMTGASPEHAAPSLLTTRETEILRWTADGKTAGQISDILTISDNTVNFHIKNAMAKLQTSNKTSAAVRAAMMGILVDADQIQVVAGIASKSQQGLLTPARLRAPPIQTT